MPTILGSGERRYRVVENWAKLPEGRNLTDVASVAVDSRDRNEAQWNGLHRPCALRWQAAEFHHR
jgi:hypothetical protein